jgi:hypothetical protein
VLTRIRQNYADPDPPHFFYVFILEPAFANLSTLMCTVLYESAFIYRYGEMPLLPGTVRSQFIFRPISPERAAGGPAEENGKTARLDRLSPESDSGRSYSSRSRSESGSRRSEEGSRTPEEDMSRATTPGNTTELGGFLIPLLTF